MDSIDRIFVINCKHRTDRLESIRRELTKLGVWEKTEIIEATYDPENRPAGCAYSQYRAIGLATPYKRVMILEDDAIFLVPPETFNDYLQRFWDYAKDAWDMLFFGSFCQWNWDHQDLSQTFCVRPFCLNHATGYVINCSYYKTMRTFFRTSYEMLKLTGEGKYSPDSMWNPLVVRDKWYVFTTKLAGQASNYSDIQKVHMPGGHEGVGLNLEKERAYEGPDQSHTKEEVS